MTLCVESLPYESTHEEKPDVSYWKTEQEFSQLQQLEEGEEEERSFTSPAEVREKREIGSALDEKRRDFEKRA